MPLGSLASTAVVLEDGVDEGFGVSLTMVDVEVERLKVFASGARCVSLSSVLQSVQFSPQDITVHALFVSFQDMVAGVIEQMVLSECGCLMMYEEVGCGCGGLIMRALAEERWVFVMGFVGQAENEIVLPSSILTRKRGGMDIRSCCTTQSPHRLVAMLRGSRRAGWR